MRIIDSQKRIYRLTSIGYPKKTTDKRKLIKTILIDGESVEFYATSEKNTHGYTKIKGATYRILLKSVIEGRTDFIHIPDGTEFRRITKILPQYEQKRKRITGLKCPDGYIIPLTKRLETLIRVYRGLSIGEAPKIKPTMRLIRTLTLNGKKVNCYRSDKSLYAYIDLGEDNVYRIEYKELNKIDDTKEYETT